MVLDAVRQLVRRLPGEEHPVLRFSAETRRFIEVAAASATLRARAIRDELGRALAAAMAESVGRAAEDVGAALVLAGWTVALQHGYAALQRDGSGTAAGRQRDGSGTAAGRQRGGSEAGARAAFLELADRGARGAAAAMAGTSYGREAG